MKKLVSFILIIIVIIVTIACYLLIHQEKANVVTNNVIFTDTLDGSVYGGVSANPDDPAFFGYLMAYNEKAIEYVEAYYLLGDVDYVDGKFKIQLQELIDKGADFSKFNVEQYSCNIDNSYVIVYQLDDGSHEFESNIDCHVK